jgi:two-component system, NarL family, response regulator LiaR
MAEIRVMVVDDHAMFRDGLRAVLEHERDMRVVGEAGDADAAITLASDLRPDVVIMDINLPTRNGIEVTRRILADNPSLRVIALSMYHDDDLIAAMIQAGARGYVLKDAHAAELLQAIRLVAAGGAAIDPAVAPQVLDLYRKMTTEGAVVGSDLTDRDREIVRLLAAGLSNRDIGASLGLSEQTIKNILSGIYRKLGVTNRTEAVAVAVSHGLIEADPPRDRVKRR